MTPHKPIDRSGNRLKVGDTLEGPILVAKGLLGEELAEYRRPWKLVTLTLGIGLLIIGSFYYQAPDWDIPISFIMAILAYLTAPWSLRVIVERRWKLWPAMLFATWFTIDGSYWLYWRFKDPVALELMREANFLASLSLYGICGVVWFYRGSLRQLHSDVVARLHALISSKSS